MAVDHFIGYAQGLPNGLREIEPTLAAIVAAFVRGPTEAAHLRTVADCVRQAARFEIPVVCHIYPRNSDDATISFEPEDIAWAVRCSLEVGVDVIKAPYCGDVEAQRRLVAACPLPVVAAGGPRAESLESALTMIGEVVRSGTRGATIGRNVWGFDEIAAAVEAFKAVIHEGKTAAEALGL